MTALWLQWSGMKAKSTKCSSLGLKGSTGRKIDPCLQLSNDQIAFAPNGVKFLGLSVDIPRDRTKSRAELISKFENMLEKIDVCPLTKKQKLLIYRSGVCPRLNWDLGVEKFPISWVQKTLDSLSTRYLKRWSGLAKSANRSVLFLSMKKGGLNLSLPSTMHKRLQSSRQSQLLTSPDPCVRLMAEESLKKDLSMTRPKFSASREVREVMIMDPNYSRKSLMAATKMLVTENDEERLLDSLRHQEKQGHMSRCSSPDAAMVWPKALRDVSNEHLSFALNSAVDSLPHNANLALWKKRTKDTCSLCGERQTLIHILNTCKVARDERRYNGRHDSILAVIASTLSSHTAPSANLSSDLGSYTFPQHIVTSDLRPDIVCWDDSARKLVLVELTVCFESSFENAAQRKIISSPYRWGQKGSFISLALSN